MLDDTAVHSRPLWQARVWQIFSMLGDPADFDARRFLPYAQGRNLSARMPLWVRARPNVTREDVHSALSSHYESSWFDPALDVGAGAEHTPYRWNTGRWAVDGKRCVA